MLYDFDRIHDRRNTHSTKWDSKPADILPMWVADMDFESPRPVIEAIQRRVEHGIFGYTLTPDSLYEAVAGWVSRRHGWQLQKEWMYFVPGVVPAVHMLIQAFTRPGDKVILQTPVYYPFFRAVLNNGCQILNNPLRLENGRYTMDFEDLEKKASDPRARALILCSPHNPVGRVWTREELSTLGEICRRHGIVVISDEIHCDIVYRGYKHIPFASISGELADISATCIAPTKTFNLAGLKVSTVIIPNYKLRTLFEGVLDSCAVRGVNVLAMVAAEAAYRYGEEWLEQVLDYIRGNLEFLIDYVEKRIPSVKVIRPEGTYLVWMDFRSLGLNAQQLENLMLNTAKVWLDEGYIFGEGGEGFERINIACPRAILAEGLRRIEAAVAGLNKK